MRREEPPGSRTQLLGRAVGQSILDQLWPQMGRGLLTDAE